MNKKVQIGSLKHDVAPFGSSKETEIIPVILYLGIEVGVSLYLINN